MKTEVDAYRVLAAFELEGRVYRPGDVFYHPDYEYDERASALRRGPTFVKRWQIKDVNTEDEMIDMEQFQVLPVEIEEGEENDD